MILSLEWLAKISHIIIQVFILKSKQEGFTLRRCIRLFLSVLGQKHSNFSSELLRPHDFKLIIFPKYLTMHFLTIYSPYIKCTSNIFASWSRLARYSSMHLHQFNHTQLQYIASCSFPFYPKHTQRIFWVVRLLCRL